MIYCKLLFSLYYVLHAIYWNIILKSQGGRVVNGVPREVPRLKPKGRQAPRVLDAGLP